MIKFDEDYQLFDSSANENFAFYIAEKGYKRIDVAKSVDIHRSHLSKILNKQRKISDELRLRLNEYLGTDF